MIDKPVRNTIPDVQLSKEQRWEIIDKMTDESSNAWFNAFVQEGNAREKNRLRQEAVAKGLPVPVFAGE
ncbi:hypothetical protein FACS1894170_03830 [Planctomycetales bacterium]|nr:hypothetical protein FACS1894170_03830 [Planctomycetales bacterium]